MANINLNDAFPVQLHRMVQSPDMSELECEIEDAGCFVRYLDLTSSQRRFCPLHVQMRLSASKTMAGLSKSTIQRPSLVNYRCKCCYSQCRGSILITLTLPPDPYTHSPNPNNLSVLREVGSAQNWIGGASRKSSIFMAFSSSRRVSGVVQCYVVLPYLRACPLTSSN